MYIADAGNDKVHVFTPSGVFTSSFGGTGTTDGLFKTPWDIAISSDDKLYVTDSKNARVQVFTADGVYVSQFSVIDATATIPETDAEPRGIDILKDDINGDDLICVADNLNDKVKVYTTAGVLVTSFGGSGSDDGEFLAVNDVAFDSDGDVYAVDTNNFRIQKFSSTSTFILKFGGFNYPSSIAIDDDGFHLYY